MYADPDRPKNDKATILGDSVQVVKELRSDVKRLKCEQASLLDESRDVSEHLNLAPIVFPLHDHQGFRRVCD